MDAALRSLLDTLQVSWQGRGCCWRALQEGTAARSRAAPPHRCVLPCWKGSAVGVQGAGLRSGMAAAQHGQLRRSSIRAFRSAGPHPVQDAGAGEARQRFALLCIGELGGTADLSSFPTLPDALTAALRTEAIAEAASQALGGARRRRLPAFINTILIQVCVFLFPARCRRVCLRPRPAGPGPT